MKLFGYWRSSASYRVRIALNLKEIQYETVPVHLLKDGGQQKTDAYAALNPAQLVPTLITDDGVQLNQSLAIIEYLDALVPSPALVPKDPLGAAVVRTLALDMAADLQPITNLRVLQYLTGTLKQPEASKVAWIHHWVSQAFGAFEKRLETTAGRYCVGDTVTLADVCLMPQVYNAERFAVDMTPYPRIRAVVAQLRELPAFIQASPELQPDANT
ncbi:maleylacetoacetate isomerase [Aliidiomarina sanyensis]|uniref:Maleylacetoacetate isomerase n=1 Tax=Aliidiomarina sanyensis TaxID=1249555 RepID=A0A432WRJ7_9GAMM|nr:maleylacetoacetate isomerase [Aliidiomarina sanyensis]RUO36413.1 maleylacetoacetate isomerase [Aliidiomarina sanyensis]